MMDQHSQPVKIGQRVQEVLKPVLYADIFDYPLTFAEVYKFLEFEANPEKVEDLLNQAVAAGRLVQVDGFYSLAHRSYLAAKRRERQRKSEILWPQATHYGRWIAALPFVKLVAVTGALAVDNPRDGLDDIDYLIVTQPGRLWLCRAMIILMVRYGHLKGIHLCPNYLLSENVLNFDKGFFAAREILQMQPLYGKESYLKIRDLNPWVIRYFPHGHELSLDRIDDELLSGQQLLKKMGEFTLKGFLGDFLEKRLQAKQIKKHSARAKQYGTLDKVIFTADVCKGHFDGHSQRTMNAYRQRLFRHFGGAKLPATNGKVKHL